MPSYLILKPTTYPAGGFEVVTRAKAQDDNAAIELLQEGEVLARLVGERAYREDGERIALRTRRTARPADTTEQTTEEAL